MSQSGTWKPGASADDAWVRTDTSAIDLTSAALQAGNLWTGSVNGTLNLGVRFSAVNIPAGATILSAKITFQAAASDSATTVNLKIVGELNATPAAFSTYADFMGRSQTTAFVNWSSVAAWTAGTDYDTPDITAIIQEIVDLGGWAALNNLCLFVLNNGSTQGATTRRRPVSYNSSTTVCARLYVEWKLEQVIGETILTAEAIIDRPQPTISEEVSVNEATVESARASFSDGVVMKESLSAMAGLVVAEVVSVSESILSRASVVLAEAIVLAESTVLRIGAIVSEAVAFLESCVRSISGGLWSEQQTDRGSWTESQRGKGNWTESQRQGGAWVENQPGRGLWAESQPSKGGWTEE